MFIKNTIQLLLFSLLILFTSTIWAQDKIENLIKEQEKKALENARNFFKLIKDKKIEEAKKIISVPFVCDFGFIVTAEGIDEFIAGMAEENKPENSIKISIHSNQKSFSDNNIILKMSEKAEDLLLKSIICIDRDSLKIIGIFNIQDEDEPTIENKTKELDKKAKDEKDKVINLQKIPSKLSEITSEQEKIILDTTRDFFKNLKAKQFQKSKNNLSAPFVWVQVGIFKTTKDIDGLISKMKEKKSEDKLFFSGSLYSLEKNQPDITDNNLIVDIKSEDFQPGDAMNCVWLDRDSLRIIGIFDKKGEPSNRTTEKLKEQLLDKAKSEAEMKRKKLEEMEKAKGK